MKQICSVCGKKWLYSIKTSEDGCVHDNANIGAKSVGEAQMDKVEKALISHHATGDKSQFTKGKDGKPGLYGKKIK